MLPLWRNNKRLPVLLPNCSESLCHFSCPHPSASEMTYIVSRGALNFTNSTQPSVTPPTSEFGRADVIISYHGRSFGLIVVGCPARSNFRKNFPWLGQWVVERESRDETRIRLLIWVRPIVIRNIYSSVLRIYPVRRRESSTSELEFQFSVIIGARTSAMEKQFGWN